MATLDKELAYKNTEFVIIATQTDYGAQIDYFNTSSVEVVNKEMMVINPQAVMAIKSAIRSALNRIRL